MRLLWWSIRLLQHKWSCIPRKIRWHEMERTMRTSLIMIGLKHHLQYRLGRINAIIQNTAVETVLQELSDCYVQWWLGRRRTLPRHYLGNQEALPLWVIYLVHLYLCSHPWFTDRQHSGFIQLYNGILFITVKGASHQVPQSKRAEAFNLFKMVVEGHVSSIP